MFEEDDNDILPLYHITDPPVYDYIDRRARYNKKWHVIDDIYFNKTKQYILDSKIFKIVPTFNSMFRSPRPCHIGLACPIFYLNYTLDHKEDNKCYFKSERNYKNVRWFINTETLNITWYSTNFVSTTIKYNYNLGIDFFYEMMEDSLWVERETGTVKWYNIPYFFNEQPEDESDTVDIKGSDDEISKMIVKNINTLFI
jgi:hypothetical protein